MAITMSPLTSTGVTTNATSYTSASISPTSNRLILAGIVNTISSASTTVTPTPNLTGLGLTWTQVVTKEVNPVGINSKRVTIFRALSGSTIGSGAITIKFNSTQNNTGCGWSFAEFANVATSGVNGAGAVVQSASTSAASGTSLTVTLGVFASTRNAAYGLSVHGSNSTQWTEGSGFTKIHEHNFNTPPTAFGSQWKLNDNTVDASGANSHWAGVALEIRSTVAPTLTATRLPLPVRRLQAVSRSAVW